MGERPTAADAAGAQLNPQHPGFRTEPEGNFRWTGSEAQGYAVDEAGHIWRHHPGALGDEKWEYIAQQAPGDQGDAALARQPIGPTRPVGRGHPPQNLIDSDGNLWRWKGRDDYEFISRTVPDEGM
jgi:hypothetical protein